MAGLLSLTGALVLALTFSSVWPLPATGQEQPRMGGVLKAAMVGEPPSLDPHWTTATLTHAIIRHVGETLYTHDRNYEPIPMLAEGHTIGNDGRRYTVALRRGVKFHNGKELTSADVVSSLQRWGKMQTVGKAIWKQVESAEARDPYTVVFHLNGTSGSLLYALSSPSAVIYPKEVSDAAGDGQVTQIIGTGPYRFAEHKTDRHIKLVRFTEYSARPEPPNGFGGKRTAYLDEILFIPTPDMSVRVAGLETGEFQYGAAIKQDQYERLKKLPALELNVNKLGTWPTAVINHKQGPLTSKRLREAFQAALDMDPIMAAATGNREFYRLDGSLFMRELVWHSTAGLGGYDQRDKEKAKRLLKEAGYAGQPLRWLTTQEYDFLYKTALVAKQQLEQVGFKIDLQVVDWATLVQRRNKPELYEVFSTSFPAFPEALDPAPAPFLQCDWPGWWCHEEKDRLVQELAREIDVKKRKLLVNRIQAIFYEDVGRIKFGDQFFLHVARKELRGDFRASPGIFFWNAWLVK